MRMIQSSFFLFIPFNSNRQTKEKNFARKNGNFESSLAFKGFVWAKFELENTYQITLKHQPSIYQRKYNSIQSILRPNFVCASSCFPYHFRSTLYLFGLKRFSDSDGYYNVLLADCEAWSVEFKYILCIHETEHIMCKELLLLLSLLLIFLNRLALMVMNWIEYKTDAKYE